MVPGAEEIPQGSSPGVRAVTDGASAVSQTSSDTADGVWLLDRDRSLEPLLVDVPHASEVLRPQSSAWAVWLAERERSLEGLLLEVPQDSEELKPQSSAGAVWLVDFVLSFELLLFGAPQASDELKPQSSLPVLWLLDRGRSLEVLLLEAPRVSEELEPQSSLPLLELGVDRPVLPLGIAFAPVAHGLFDEELFVPQSSFELPPVPVLERGVDRPPPLPGFGQSLAKCPSWLHYEILKHVKLSWMLLRFTHLIYFKAFTPWTTTPHNLLQYALTNEFKHETAYPEASSATWSAAGGARAFPRNMTFLIALQKIRC